MSNQSMAAFNTAKNEMDAMVEYVMEILRGSISGENDCVIEKHLVKVSQTEKQDMIPMLFLD